MRIAKTPSHTSLGISKMVDGSTHKPCFSQTLGRICGKNVLLQKNIQPRADVVFFWKKCAINLADNELTITSDTPDAGKSEETIEIKYTAEPLLIAFNYKYLLDALKNMECDEVKIGLNTGLSATVLKPIGEEDFVCLIMPVQIR